MKKGLQAKIRFFVKDLKQPPAVKRVVEQVTVEQEKAGNNNIKNQNANPAPIYPMINKAM